jgi:hypothetical protein
MTLRVLAVADVLTTWRFSMPETTGPTGTAPAGTASHGSAAAAAAVPPSETIASTLSS